MTVKKDEKQLPISQIYAKGKENLRQVCRRKGNGLIRAQISLEKEHPLDRQGAEM